MAARIADRLRDSDLKSAGESRGDLPADIPDHALQQLRQHMASNCGVVRNARQLGAVLNEIDALEHAHGPARTLIAARLIASAALAREESRGGHFRSDFPDTNPDPQRTFVSMDPKITQPLEPAS